MTDLISNCSKLGFGMMRLPRLEDGNTIDVEQTKEMVDRFIKAGGKYFDTAFIYDGSEEATGKALCSRYSRDSYYLATKLNASAFCCKSREEALKEIEISLQRTGAEYFDFYLLHALDHTNMGRYEEFGLWDFVKELKERGLIRHYGFSFHDTADVLEEIISKHPDAEFVQLQINYNDWEDEGIQSRKIAEVANKHGLPIIVMEPVKGGLLASPPQQVRDIFSKIDPDASPASWAIRFAASVEGVMVVLSGMSNMEQMNDNMSYMEDFKPLNAIEKSAIEEVIDILSKLKGIPCTGCSYCTAGCPMEIAIPDIFTIMNMYRINNDLPKAISEYQDRMMEAPASSCVECGQCESACPQHLSIIELLKEAAATLEK